MEAFIRMKFKVNYTYFRMRNQVRNRLTRAVQIIVEKSFTTEQFVVWWLSFGSIIRCKCELSAFKSKLITNSFKIFTNRTFTIHILHDSIKNLVLNKDVSYYSQ